MLESVLGGNETSEIKLELFKRNRKDNKAENYQQIINALQDAGSKVGLLKKEDPKGEFVTSFLSLMEQSNLETFDVSRGIELALTTKEPDELVRKPILLDDSSMTYSRLRRKISGGRVP